MIRKRIFTLIKLLILLTIFVVVTAPEWPKFQDEGHKINAILGLRRFDFLVWEVNALATKAEGILSGGHVFLDEGTRKEFVLDYLALLDETRGLESRINLLYADPSVDDPQAQAADIQHQVNENRDELALRQPMMEAIIQSQVGSVLVDEGFGVLKQAWPPVEMHMTSLPYVLIVSPRNEIRQVHNIPLEHGLTVGDREEIEGAVFDQTDQSALVVSIGGLGIYPSMIVETSNINVLADVVAHEWAHHWLTLHPIGLNYAASPVLRTMNETIASIVGEEIGRKVIQRFYPEYVEPPPPAADASGTAAEDPDAFDFNLEMRETRIRVDELLGQGKVEEAESYMEERRQFLWDNGYRLRKLNQAFFAFYGAYADTPGEQGDDPIGPAILALRDDSGSLREFLDRISPITSLEELQEAVEALAAGGP